MTFSELTDKTILILGFGIEAQSTYVFLRKLFPNKLLAIADNKNLTEITLSKDIRHLLESDLNLVLDCGKDYLSKFSSYQVIIRSPGVPPSIPELISYEKQGGIVTSHLEIFFSIVGTSRVIGVTGTKGKSTTSSLIYKILNDNGITAVLVGNIGAPPLSVLDKMSALNPWWILELSSYQLDQISLSPHIAVLLAITPEHLGLQNPQVLYAHHQDFEHYISAKKRITLFQNKNDILIFNADNEIASKIATASAANLFAISQSHKISSGSYIEGTKLIYAVNGSEQEIIDTKQINLLGKFNQINVMAAITVAKQVGVSEQDIVKSVTDFYGLPHRLEYVGEFAEVKYYDDSIATVPEATIQAIEALGDKVSTVILGGHDRGNDFSELAALLIRRNIKNVILFKPSGLRISEELQKQRKISSQEPIEYFPENMSEAVNIARNNTKKGEICLLSPASPSFGMFKNFEERGQIFKAELKKQTKGV